ncbi:GNAT family N-acetyltransferase [Solimonas fluminis]|uniref:GNAT family N-acetyltransferase n=1 Tax=Solimonas fluminis TaxID=2086571 RepID=A0A2S5TD45_9GAMM|nr:GNAT family N-acetyltransferase [Solimonas fluminis]PPE72895.1 GNAT family N-acetyltransferase [Solimonas fluminis]
MRLRQVGRIAEVPAPAWDALFPPDYPFTRHAFLSALERHRCVGGDSGWEPCHLLAEADDGSLAGAAPLYLKQHSYGEFVFDFGWAEASHRIGRRYYPKLLCAIPFTPATGPRLGARDAGARTALAAQLTAMGRDTTSLHALFVPEADQAPLREAGMLERQDIQFHWFNRGYPRFEDFLAGLAGEKRKKIRQERRRVAEAGIRFEWRAGHELRDSEWVEVFALYANTYEERGQAPYLSLPFLQDFGSAPDTPLRFAMAYDGSRLVAMAMTLQGGDTLYGRHWGSSDRYHALHFETCYYQGIEYSIGQGLRRYDAGTQGEHKLARGFVPVRTRSAHILADERLHKAVAAHLQRETAFVELRHAELMRHVPYKKEGAS